MGVLARAKAFTNINNKEIEQYQRLEMFDYSKNCKNLAHRSNDIDVIRGRQSVYCQTNI